MKKIFLVLLLCFVVLEGCITLPVRMPSDEILEQQESKYFSYLNRLDHDFWSRVSYCVVYIIIQPYFKGEGFKTEDYLFKYSREKPLLPSNIQIEYVIATMEDILRTDWKKADAYVVLDLGGMMVPKDTGSRPEHKLILITKITVIPKNSVGKWKEFRIHLEQVKKTEIIKERRKVISENKVPNVYEEVVIKSTGYFDEKTWGSNDGKFFIEQFQGALAPLTERLRQKLSFK